MPLSSLSPGVSPQIWLGPTGRHEVCLGAFQRAASALRSPPLPVTRRLSGGPALWLAPDTLHLLLLLPSPSTLFPDADPHRLVNRHVRPLLRALRRAGAPAIYPGRDWIAVDHRPTCWVGFAHHAASGVCAFEAFLPLSEPFALPPHLDGYPPRDRPPFLGKTPETLRDRAGAPVDPGALTEAVLAAYRGLDTPVAQASWPPSLLRPDANDPRPPWDALVEEAVGFVGASAGPDPGLGGDFFASEDLIDAISCELQRLPPSPLPGHLHDALARAASGGGVFEGVASLDSLLSALSRAFSAPGR